MQVELLRLARHSPALHAITLLLVIQSSSADAQSSKSTAPRELSLDPPHLTIADAALDGSWAITGMGEVRRAPDGRFLIPTNTEIHVFSERGAHSVMGRKGKGPGEFTNISGVVGCADGRVVVSDWIQQRLTILPSTRGDATVVPFPKGMNPSVVPFFCDARGVVFRESLMSTRTSTPWPRNTPRQDTILVFRASPTLNRVDTIGRVPSGWSFNGLAQPFGAAAITLMNGAVLVTGRSDDSVFQLIPATGQPRRIVVPGLRVVPVTAKMRADRTAQSEAKTPPSIWNAELRDAFANVPWPGHLPLWGRALVDDASRLWISDYTSPLDTAAASMHWRVIDRSGAVLGVLKLDPSDRLVAVRSNEAVVVHRNDDDTESLHLHRIRGLPATDAPPRRAPFHDGADRRH